MANTPHTQSDAPEMDYPAHEATYRGFVSMVKWSVLVLAVGAVVLYFIVQP